MSNSDPWTYSVVNGEADVDSLLANFHSWRSNSANSVPAHDNGHLLSALNFQGSTIGYAGIGTMCLAGSSGGIDQVTFSDVFNALTVAHEMGHNFGMRHDGYAGDQNGDFANSCNPTNFIMASSGDSSSSNQPSQFSTCSQTYYADWLANNGDVPKCLKNKPVTAWGAPVCGDGFVEDGEACDCGDDKDNNCNTRDPCCNSQCQLRSGKECASEFECCTSQCTFVTAASNTVCRPSIGECDVAEKCSGVSHACPVDSFVTSGTACNDGTSATGGSCYRGECWSLTKQCKTMEPYYSTSIHPFVKCQYQDHFNTQESRTFCGWLYCGTKGDTASCTSLVFNQEHVWVSDGVECDTGKQCFNEQCVASSTLNPTVSYSWDIGNYGACSVECGGGTETRTVVCKSNTGAVAADSSCPQPKPATSQSCNTQACVTYSWHTGTPGTCSKSCGGGTQTRTVTCKGSDGNTYADNKCSGTKPATTLDCNTQACTSYFWDEKEWSTCSKTCGDGTQTRTVQCKGSDGQLHDESNCPAPKPATSRSCNQGACPTYSWSSGEWSSCSVACGGGTQTRTVECKSSTGPVVDDSYCSGAGTKPATSQSCNTAACETYNWEELQWGPCSKTCGDGTRSRVVRCTAQSNGAIVDDSNCDAQTKPATSGSCNEGACPTYSWSDYEWGSCSLPCGSGTQTRTVECLSSLGGAVDDSYCSNAGAKPASSQACNTGPCATYEWVTGAWSSCSVTCGGGTETRTVQCKNTADNTVAASESSCTATKPQSSRSCNTGPCPTYSWETGGWGACTVSCGGGTHSRTVTCKSSTGESVDDNKCTETKPATSESCNTQACTYKWKTGEWSECTKQCDGGTRQRSVVCTLEVDGTTVAESNCDAGSKPSSSEACNTAACTTSVFFWEVTSWGDCVANANGCGDGKRTRVVSCTEYRESQGGEISFHPATDANCTSTKPASTMDCYTTDCVTHSWVTGEWGACSKSCGTGQRTRTVICQGSDSSVADDSKCTETKPAASENCNTQACPVLSWVTGDWGACSKPCGGGTRTRTVECRTPDASHTDPSGESCTGDKPASSEACNTASCSSFEWRPSGWGACSKLCGGGKRTRAVPCIQIDSNTGAETTVPDSECTTTRPDVEEPCNTHPCQQAGWSTGPWGECSKKCDTGQQTRTVTCELDGVEKPDGDCASAGAKPATSQDCNTHQCPDLSWQTGSWSACSKTCDEGVQTREVWCQEKAKPSNEIKVVPDSVCTDAGISPPATQQACLDAVCNPCLYKDCNVPKGKCYLDGNNEAKCYCFPWLGYSGSSCRTAPSIRVVTPTAGDKYPGQTYSITWTWTGEMPRVSILLQRQGDSWPRYLKVLYKNTGSYTWKMPVTTQPGSYNIIVAYRYGIQGVSATFKVVDPCEKGIVQCNKGVCVIGSGGQCDCSGTGGYTGDRCEVKPKNPCEGVDCNFPYGTCKKGKCECDKKVANPHTGARCEIPPACNLRCFNNGKVKDAPNKCEACDCALGGNLTLPDIDLSTNKVPSVLDKIKWKKPSHRWIGKQCDECPLRKYCFNGGDSDGECKKCKCPRKWTGLWCHVRRVFARMKLKVDYKKKIASSEDNRRKFQDAFVSAISAALGIESDRVVVQDISDGTYTNVEFELLESANANGNATIPPDESLKSLQAQVGDETSAFSGLLIGQAAVSVAEDTGDDDRNSSDDTANIGLLIGLIVGGVAVALLVGLLIYRHRINGGDTWSFKRAGGANSKGDVWMSSMMPSSAAVGVVGKYNYSYGSGNNYRGNNGNAAAKKKSVFNISYNGNRIVDLFNRFIVFCSQSFDRSQTP
eukprot:TRINITY_DN65790_c14_g1_i2.p1 TRINITY_DN65790_c14_g1~~TRINITY_DN65790_c14_g1_i2.p1  ORF type:complete len:1985 (+),score=893.63 TRINITY_DN65790_c14_g1_i2:504-5957(+)